MSLAFFFMLVMTFIMCRCASSPPDHPTRDLVVVAAWLLTGAASLVWMFLLALGH